MEGHPTAVRTAVQAKQYLETIFVNFQASKGERGKEIPITPNAGETLVSPTFFIQGEQYRLLETCQVDNGVCYKFPRLLCKKPLLFVYLGIILPPSDESIPVFLGGDYATLLHPHSSGGADFPSGLYR